MPLRISVSTVNGTLRTDPRRHQLLVAMGLVADALGVSRFTVYNYLNAG